MNAQRARTTPDEFEGMEIGRYEVIRRLAVGGMAEIFLARDRGVQGVSRQVVLKCVLPSISSDPAFVDLFLDEIRIVARLSHQNIAHLYDFGEADGRYYLVMEYIDGAHVSQLMRGHHPEMLAIEHVVKIGSLVAEALYYAHTLTDDEGHPLSIIHRDVSPENIMVSRQGQVKLLDFGVARARDQVHQTQVGVLRGKAAYLSPEQCMAKPFDRRVDIFALGTVLHEMLCGRRLFKRDTDFQTMRAVCSGPIPRPSTIRPGVSDDLDTIIMRALERKASERYQQADEMAFDLERVLQDCRLLSNQILLGRFVVNVVSKVEESKTNSVDSAEQSADVASASVSGVRQTSEPMLESPPTKRASFKRGKGSTLELALAIDLDEALSELTSAAELDAEKDRGVGAKSRSGSKTPKPWTRSIDIAIEQGVLVNDLGAADEIADETMEEPLSKLRAGTLGLREVSTRPSAPPRHSEGNPASSPRLPPSRPVRMINSDPSGNIEMASVVRRGFHSDFLDEDDDGPPTKVESLPISAELDVDAPVEPRSEERARGPSVSPEPASIESAQLLNLNDAGLDLSLYGSDAADEADTNIWTGDDRPPVRLKEQTPPKAMMGHSADSSGAWSADAAIAAELTDQGRSFTRGRLLLPAIIGVAALALLVTAAWLALREPSGDVPAVGVESAEGSSAEGSSAEGSALTEERPSSTPSGGHIVEPTPAPVASQAPTKTDGSGEPSTATLVVDIESGDEVIIDDVIVSAAAVKRGVSIGDGAHTVRVLRPRHRPWVERVDAEAGASIRLKARPRRAGRRWGLLNITSRVKAKVFVSGVLVGETPVSGLVLWSGPHEVELEATDGRRASRNVLIRRARTTEIEVRSSSFLSAHGSGQGEQQAEDEQRLSPRRAFARARTAAENGDYEGCIAALHGQPVVMNMAAMLLSCHESAGNHDQACEVARSARRCRRCSRFAASQCAAR